MNDPIVIDVNFPEWARALKAYESEVKNHDLPYILNKRGRNIASKASRFTPKATKKEIDMEMTMTASGGKAFRGKAYGPWLFVLTNAQRKRKGLPVVGGRAMSGPAQSFLKKRHSSIAYIKAGWTPAIIKFGGHSNAHISKASKINEAQNKLASTGDLVAILENTAAEAGKIGRQALQKAIDVDTQDMLEHVARLQKTANKYSAK